MAATIAPAPKRHQRNLLITLAAAARKADLAPRHYRLPPPGDMPRKAPSAASPRRSGSDGALRLGPRARTSRSNPSVTGAGQASRRPDGRGVGPRRRLHPRAGPVARRRDGAAPGPDRREARAAPSVPCLWSAPGHGTHSRPAPGKRGATPKRITATLKAVKELRPARTEITICTGLHTRGGHSSGVLGRNGAPVRPEAEASSVHPQTSRQYRAGRASSPGIQPRQGGHHDGRARHRAQALAIWSDSDDYDDAINGPSRLTSFAWWDDADGACCRHWSRFPSIVLAAPCQHEVPGE